MYINDIVDNISCNIRLFADDTFVFITSDDDYALGYRTINSDWADKWEVKVSLGKTKSVNVSSKIHTYTQID